MAARHSAKSKLSAKAPGKKASGTAAASRKAPAKKAAAEARRGASGAVPKKAPAKGTAKAATKATAKSTKAAAKPVAKKVAAAGARRGAAKAPVAKKTAAKATKAAAPVKALKGVSGGKSARIAQIVAESFLPKPQPAPAPAPQAAASDDTLRAAHRIAAELFAKKAEDVVLMDLRNLSTVADYYLIATCRNEPQMRALLGGVQRALSREGVRPLRSEYMPGVRWAVVDFGDIILHLFEKQTRAFYSLERLWADAPSTTLRAEDYVSAENDDETERDQTTSHDDL